MKKLLLHTCCAPCGIAIIDELKSRFQLTVFFYNPNIFPEEEYLKRKAEVIKVCREWGIPVVDMDYEAEQWDKAVAGLEKEPESGTRCLTCFQFRLAKAAEYTAQNNFDYFASTLTMGRNKKAETINPIGLALAKKFGIKFYEEDWKKNGPKAEQSSLQGKPVSKESRWEKNRRMVAERNIYRQNYCGCKYSL